MLAEWLRYITTSCPPHVRDMGYLRELIGIKSRHARCRHAWADHLARARAAIAAAAEAAPGRDKALVIGAGLWLDVPVEDLTRRFRQVVLADVFHLPAMRRRARGFSNLRLDDVDVTGLAQSLHRHRRTDGGPPVSYHAEGFDLIVSANLLSQLPVLPRRFMEDRWTEAQLEILARRMIADHLDWLGGFAGRVCLIADVERLTCQGDAILERRDTLHGVALPEGGAEWMWNLAPRPEQDPHHDIRLRVRAFIDLKSGI